MRVVALLAAHNRRASTLNCLSSYFRQEVEPGVGLSAVLVDDGSSDGTASAVRERFPEVVVLKGDGSLFWAQAMALAEQTARELNPDFLLWLNDDVVLDRAAVQRLTDTAALAGGDACVVVGAVRDPVSAEITYSGVRRSRFHPLRFTLVEPSEHPIEVDTFNGNVVLISGEAMRRVGSIDGGFRHEAADFDYGLRARKAGVPRLLAPGALGVCTRNAASAPWADRSIGVGQRWRALISEKGYPPRSRARYLRRHGGPAWPVFWVSPYLRALPSLLRPRKSLPPRQIRRSPR
jgi:GT2 family glycosyltransferase